MSEMPLRCLDLKQFYIPDSTGEMKYLPKDPHNFTLTSVLDEHKSRLTEPTAVMDSTGMETSASKQAHFKSYNQYELCDFSL